MLGTGTAVGDPLEVEALSKVMSPGRTEPLIIGAVSSSPKTSMVNSSLAVLIEDV